MKSNSFKFRLKACNKQSRKMILYKKVVCFGDSASFLLSFRVVFLISRED